MSTLWRAVATKPWTCGACLVWLICLLALPVASRAEMPEAARLEDPGSKPLAEVLPAAEWKQVESSVDRALVWLARKQAPDGSFPTLASGQPAVTSLAVLAFLSRGHQPGLGPYGGQLERAIDNVLNCQRADGLLCSGEISTRLVLTTPSHTATYNHAIAGLMLGEVYGHVQGTRGARVKEAIQKALDFTRALQTRPKELPADKGGWRYLALRFPHGASDSDLSVTSWQLMFLRSARNAEFEVPQEQIDEALEYVMRCWKEDQGVFYYALSGPGDIRFSRSMVSAGILSLALAGKHHTHVALKAGDWLLRHPYQEFGELSGNCDRFFYGAYYYSQAAAQLGGRYWELLFPPLVTSLLSSQGKDGSWPPEPGPRDGIFGTCYTTSLAVLSLTPPYQLLPVYQR